jgi:hypothetical protein
VAFRLARAWTALPLLLAVASCTLGSGGGEAEGPAPQQAPGGRAGPPPGRGRGGGPFGGGAPAGLEATIDSVPQLLALGLDTVRWERINQGRMWPLEMLPASDFQTRYGFTPDSAWVRTARLASLRIPQCSASFVSPNGLVLTAHHCVRDALTRATRSGENLLRDGFVAASLADERAAADLHADQLIAIRDVTEELERRLAQTPASLKPQRRQELRTEIAQRIKSEFGGQDGNAQVELTELYGGSRTSAYVFRRYTDVRLVMAPEEKVGYFGGDPDNFTYPRFTPDFAFLRVYDAGGRPLASDSYFRVNQAPIAEGAASFVVGSPGPTERQETLAQLVFRRDVVDRTTLAFFTNRARAFERFVRDYPNSPYVDDVRGALFELQNARKAYEGEVIGLRDPSVLARVRNRDTQLTAAIVADTVLKLEVGDVVERMQQLQVRRRAWGGAYAFVGIGNGAYESSTLQRAFLASRYLQSLRQAEPIVRREAIKRELLAVKSRPASLDAELIQDRLQELTSAYGSNSALTGQLLAGRSVEGAADYLSRTSIFADSARAAAAVLSERIPLDDPALAAIEAMLATLARFDLARGQMDAQEAALESQISSARWVVYGTTEAPDATLTPRLSDGVVRGYTPKGGSPAPAFTTILGLFTRYDEARSGDGGRSGQPSTASPWDLPPRWVDARIALTRDLDTPINFAATNDITGGNSGSAIVGRDLGLLGVVFDGNAESLTGSSLYLPDTHRTVAVDARGIVAVLRSVYRLTRIVNELTTGQLSRSGEVAPFQPLRGASRASPESAVSTLRGGR